MCDEYNQKYRFPDDWTAEQVDFLSNFLYDLNEALLEDYHYALRALWQERDRDRFLAQRDQADQTTSSATEPKTDDDLPF